QQPKQTPPKTTTTHTAKAENNIIDEGSTGWCSNPSFIGPGVRAVFFDPLLAESFDAGAASIFWSGQVSSAWVKGGHGTGVGY
ncbi:hypothetical protein, partial [Mycobacteroides abscessus]|uniref:hypothetical protein n=1 Tax=Mycobacteroides abscessus TaxID=36809 RepID=UPI0019500E98